MYSKAKTVSGYLASLPADRRRALEAVRHVILENLDGNFEEGMQYGMISYYVPHRVYPAGYHCDPRQPLPFTCLAAQKNHMALYIMSIYAHPDEQKWFDKAWAKTGKKLDRGKCCVRFKKLEDLALDVIGQAIRRMTAKRYISICESSLAAQRKHREKQERRAAAAAKPTKAKTQRRFR